MRALRKLVLGETWELPLGVALVLGAGLALDAVAGGAAWWRDGGGFLLLAGVLLTLSGALPRVRSPREDRREQAERDVPAADDRDELRLADLAGEHGGGRGGA